MHSSACHVKESKYFTPAQLGALDPDSIPKHIAIIMDGNRRWALNNNKYSFEGHHTGAEIVTDILKSGKELGIKVITLYVFSTENWNRTKEEITALMWLYETYIRKQIPDMLEYGIRFDTIGDIEKLPLTVRNSISEAKEATKHCDSMDVLFAMNYGARDEIKRAFCKMHEDIKAGLLSADDVSETTITSYLDTSSFPDPDLLIRTSGEYRISNFLLWQLSYAEVHVIPTMWPDFSPNHLFQAVIEYQQRVRRIGK